MPLRPKHKQKSVLRHPRIRRKGLKTPEKAYQDLIAEKASYQDLIGNRRGSITTFERFRVAYLSLIGTNLTPNRIRKIGGPDAETTAAINKRFGIRGDKEAKEISRLGLSAARKTPLTVEDAIAKDFRETRLTITQIAEKHRVGKRVLRRINTERGIRSKKVRNEISSTTRWATRRKKKPSTADQIFERQLNKLFPNGVSKTFIAYVESHLASQQKSILTMAPERPRGLTVEKVKSLKEIIEDRLFPE